jgi:hypothetical protein
MSQSTTSDILEADTNTGSFDSLYACEKHELFETLSSSLGEEWKTYLDSGKDMYHVLYTRAMSLLDPNWDIKQVFIYSPSSTVNKALIYYHK